MEVFMLSRMNLLLRVCTVLICIVGFFSMAQPAYAQGAVQQTESNETEYWIYTLSLKIGGFVTSAGGGIFDIAIDNLVLKMGCWYVKEPKNDCDGIGGQGSVGGVVNALWTVVRDLFNIFFIFSLVYIGLRLILFADDSSTKRTLGLLIAAALLINFSLYFTKVIVDVANYTAVAVHHVAASGVSGDFRIDIVDESEDGTTTTIGSGDGDSLSSAFMQVLTIATWFDTKNGLVEDPIGIVAYSILMLLFLIILGITLGFGGIMLISRFIMITIFMIFSPVMFLGWILPQLQSYTVKWWKLFLSYTFFAPAYIFMLYLALYTLSQLGNTFEGQGYAAAFKTGMTWSQELFSVFVFYAIGIGFLFAATKVAQNMGVAGAGTAMSVSQGTLRSIKNGGVGAVKWGARGVGNHTGTYIGGKVAAQAQSYGKKMDAADAANENTPSRRRRALRALVKRGETAKFGGSTSYKDRMDEDKAADKSHARAHALHNLSQTIESGSKPTATDAEKIAMEETLSSASTPQLLDMAKSKSGMKTLKSVAGSLTPSQVKSIMGSDDINDDVKREFGNVRTNGLRNRMIERGGTLETGMSKASSDELTELDYQGDLMKNAMYLQEGQMDDLKKKWGAESEKFNLLKKKREAELLSGNMNEIVKTRKDSKELAKLPPQIIENYDFIAETINQGKMNVDLLKKIASESSANKQVIKMKIENAYSGTVPEGIRKYFDSPQGVDYV